MILHLTQVRDDRFVSANTIKRNYARNYIRYAREVGGKTRTVFRRNTGETLCNWQNRRIKRELTEPVTLYASRMESQHATYRLNAAANPIYQYSSKSVNTPNGQVNLPLVIRAKIEARHIQLSNTRPNNAISNNAKDNCRRMGMNSGRSDNNNDVFGHLIAYKNGGPSDFYNIVPQTNRINIGTITNTPINAPSIWAASEREITNFITSSRGGWVEVTVVVFYNGAETRPGAFGISEVFKNSAGAVVQQCSDYFYSNNPDVDPDSFNA